MAKQFAVLHIEKGSGNATRLGSHIDRKFQPKNADPQRRHLNNHVITTGNKLNEDIDNRIKKVGCKVRKNSVKHLNIVLTGSHERMKEIEKDPKLLKQWANENYKFLKQRYGKENIMRLSLHRDERTPHLHAVVTPITKDGRLSAKEIVGNKNDLRQLQDDYAAVMEKYQLKRGVEGSKATHDSIQEYYARINNPVKANIEVPIKKRFESKEKYFNRVIESLTPFALRVKAAEEVKEKKSDLDNKERLLSQKEKEIGQRIQASVNLTRAEEQSKKEQELNQVKTQTFKETYEKALAKVNGVLEKQGFDKYFKADFENDKLKILDHNQQRNKNRGQGMEF